MRNMSLTGIGLVLFSSINMSRTNIPAKLNAQQLSRWPKSLGEDIKKFLNKNKDLELVDIKYSSFGFLLSSNREENYRLCF